MALEKPEFFTVFMPLSTLLSASTATVVASGSVGLCTHPAGLSLYVSAAGSGFLCEVCVLGQKQ